jgi:hypothetical protein
MNHNQLSQQEVATVTASQPKNHTTKASVNTNVNLNTKSASSLSSANDERMTADASGTQHATRLKRINTQSTIKKRSNQSQNNSVSDNHVNDLAEVSSAVVGDIQKPTTAFKDNQQEKPSSKTIDNKVEVKKKTELPPAEEGERLLAQTERNHAKNNSRWSFALGTTYTSNVGSSGIDNGDDINAADVTASNSNFSGNNDFHVGYTMIELKHHIPIRIGFTAEKKISRHIGIASGINGTYLLSTPKDDYLSHKNDQRIYYIGVPVKLNLYFSEGKRFSMYWSNGIEAEKCIYARRSGEHLHLNKLQMSVNTAIGAQYEIFPKLSVYAEPGISYYWGNGTDIETYRTENPTCFDFHIGLKLDY